MINSSNNISRLNPNFVGKLGKGRLNIQEALVVARAQLVSYSYNLVVAPATNEVGNIAITDQTGNVKKQFLAYDKNFRGGVNVAAGDIDGDGKDEIVTGVNSGVSPQVKIFNQNGGLIKQFLAYDKNFRGGVNVAAGDIDGDGKDEIVTGAGNGGGPQVKIFDGDGNLKSLFFAYDKKFRGGINVAVADVDGGARNKKKEIITAPGVGGGPQIVIFNNYAQRINQFFAYDKNFHGGVNIYGGDIDNDGLDEIITGAGLGGAPHVRVFKKNGTLIYSFYSLNKDFTGGVNVAAIKY